jgi:hypothetical protein
MNTSGEVFGIAPSRLEARKQMAWFLPKDKYIIEPIYWFD